MQAVQKTDPKFMNMKDDTTWSIQAINNNLNLFKKAPPEWTMSTLQLKIRTILLQLLHELRSDLHNIDDCFELFGCDVLIDRDLNVSLL